MLLAPESKERLLLCQPPRPLKQRKSSQDCLGGCSMLCVFQECCLSGPVLFTGWCSYFVAQWTRPLTSALLDGLPPTALWLSSSHAKLLQSILFKSLSLHFLFLLLGMSFSSEFAWLNYTYLLSLVKCHLLYEIFLASLGSQALMLWFPFACSDLGYVIGHNAVIVDMMPPPVYCESFSIVHST